MSVRTEQIDQSFTRTLKEAVERLARREAQEREYLAQLRLKYYCTFMPQKPVSTLARDWL